MKNEKTVKCAYKHCRYEDKNVLQKDSIKIKTRYYHKECYEDIKNIDEIIRLFKEYVNPNVVYTVLRKVVNTIVYDKKIESEFLLFGLKYYIKNKIPLNYPQGLYYVIQNKNVSKCFEEKKVAKIKRNFQDYEYVGEEAGEQEFNFKSQHRIGFGDIIKG